MVEARVTLDRAYNNDNADNARLNLIDHVKWYHMTCAECVKHGVMCGPCRREERIWQQHT